MCHYVRLNINDFVKVHKIKMKCIKLPPMFNHTTKCISIYKYITQWFPYNIARTTDTQGNQIASRYFNLHISIEAFERRNTILA